MEADLLRLFAVVGGTLAFIGALLNFVNGRLNEAKTDLARNQVYQKTWAWLSTVLFITGTIISSLWQYFAAASVLYVLAFIIQTYAFLKLQNNVSRIEIVFYSLQSAVVISLLVMSFVFSMFNRIILIQEHMIATQNRLMDSSTAKPKP